MAIHKTQAGSDQPQRTRILIIESESGWGQKVDERLYADTPDEASQFAKDYNDKYNPPGPTPSWYMKATVG
jgi:hypothetical protein